MCGVVGCSRCVRVVWCSRCVRVVGCSRCVGWWGVVGVWGGGV